MILLGHHDETLFSYCSRYHRLSGNALASHTCQQLFGHRYSGSQHDIGPRLDEFSRRTEGAIGTSSEIAFDRTVLPFLLLFRAQRDWEEALTVVRGVSVAHLKYRLGGLTSGFRANFPLKACPACVEEDLSRAGESYWHLSHQYPTVLVCPTHGLSLAEYQRKANGVGRFLWHLPDEVSANRERYKLNEWHNVDRLRDLAGLTLGAVAHAKTERFDVARLQATYATALHARGLLTSAGNLRAKRAAEEFCDEMKFVSAIPALSPIEVSPNRAALHLPRLFTQAGRSTQPIRHLVAMQWLFGTWESFRTVYQTSGPARAPRTLASPAQIPVPIIDDPRMHAALTQKIVAQNQSLRQSAAELRIDIKTAMAIAARLGLSIRRRPKKLKGEIRTEIVRSLSKGNDKAKVAQHFGVSVQTITTTLQTEPGLSGQWHSARRQALRTANRESFREARDSNPEIGIKALRLIRPAAYAWLYRNDRDWLHQLLETVPAIQRGATSPINWDERDAALASSVITVAEQLFASSPSRKLSLQDIYARLPELKTKLSALSRLPRTQQALDQVVRARRKSGPQLF